MNATKSLLRELDRWDEDLHRVTTAMNPYVGIANAVPGSLTPRRFINAGTLTPPANPSSAPRAPDPDASLTPAPPILTLL